MTWADGFTSLPKEGELWTFITVKNPSHWVGFEPANLGSNLRMDLRVLQP